MRLEHGLVAVFLMASLPAVQAHAATCAEADIPTVVKRMGYWPNTPDADDMEADMHCLGEHGPTAAKLLIAELHPIPETDISAAEQEKYPKSMHVIWCLRGLHYITGLNFMAGSADAIRKQKLGELREYWLLFQSGDNVRMYSTWMSRDAVFIAPQDVQLAVIDKWKNWYAANGATFQYKTQSNFIDWYF